MGCVVELKTVSIYLDQAGMAHALAGGSEGDIYGEARLKLSGAPRPRNVNVCFAGTDVRDNGIDMLPMALRRSREG
jgi:hypothetical protein